MNDANLEGPYAVPYAHGYGSMHYVWHDGIRATFGANYFADNNPYTRPGFLTMNGALSAPLHGVTLTIAGENIFGNATASAPTEGASVAGFFYRGVAPQRTLRVILSTGQ